MPPALTAIVDDRWVGRHGIGRFAQEIIKRCPQDIIYRAVPERRYRLHPLDPWRVARSICDEPADMHQASADRVRRVYFTPGFNPPRDCGLPLVFAVHDLIHLNHPGVGGWMRRAYFQRIVRPAARRARTVITVSEYSKGTLLKYLDIAEDKIVVVGNGVGEPFVDDGWRAERGRPYVVCVANERPHKNVATLINAWNGTAARDEHDLVLVGCGKLRIGRGEAAKRLRHDPPRGLQWVDQCHDHDLAELLRGAVAAVVPSLDEGFGLPAIEAMACGTPLICSSGGSLPEVVGLENALFVDPRSHRSIAAAIDRIIGDASLRHRLRRRGIDRAATYRWDDVAARVWHVIRDAADTI